MARIRTALCRGLAGAALALLPLSITRAAVTGLELWDCAPVMVTGYLRYSLGPVFADGEPVWIDDPFVAAASHDFKMHSYVHIFGLGVYHIRDRGYLGSSNRIDVAVSSEEEAYALTGEYVACVIGEE